jgi:hypothetical protein
MDVIVALARPFGKRILTLPAIGSEQDDDKGFWTETDSLCVGQFAQRT